VCVDNAAQALVQAPEADLLLIDLHLPDRSGLDLLRMLKADPRTHAIAAIMVSADAQPSRTWDILVISALLFSSEGFDGELYLMYFLIIFMSGLMSQARQSFLIGTVSSLVYVALWANGKTGEGLSLTSLLLRFAFFYVTSFFTAIMAERVRFSEQRAKSLALRMALGRIANGGWGAMMDDELSPSLDPDLAKSIRTINALMDNLTQALRHTAKQNEDLRAAAEGALLHLAHEKERLGSLAERHYSTS
jgi:CheY-like chemotaxis protein